MPISLVLLRKAVTDYAISSPLILLFFLITSHDFLEASSGVGYKVAAMMLSLLVFCGRR